MNMIAFDAWFEENNLIPFKKLFVDNGYDELEVVASITDSELKEIGVNLSGHHKKILLRTMRLSKKMKLDGDPASKDRDESDHPKTPAEGTLKADLSFAPIVGQAFIPNEDEVDLTDTPMVTEDQAFISNEDEADLSDAPIMTEDEAFIQNQDEDLNLARPSTSSPEVATQEQPQKNESTSPTVTKVVEDRNLAGPSSKSSTFMDALKGNKYINAKMKNIKIYSEQEINSQKDMERQRRTFWNEKAEQLAKSPKTSNCSKTTIVGIIDVAWTLRKTTLIEAEARKLIQSEKELFDKEDLASGKKLGKQKQETLPSNLDRMAAAHSAVEAIDADMEGCQKKFKKGKSIQQRKNDNAEYKRQKALMDGAYTELKRAQEATIKSIKAKQQQLEIRLGEKKEDSEAEPE